MGIIEDKDIELHIDRETLLQEYIPRKDYERRLKADMVAMLTEILLEIEQCGVEDSHWIIKQKINALKENKDE